MPDLLTKEAICLVDIACSGTKAGSWGSGEVLRNCNSTIPADPHGGSILVWGRTGRVVLELQGSFSLHFNVPDAEAIYLGPSWTFPGPLKVKRDDHGMNGLECEAFW